MENKIQIFAFFGLSSMNMKTVQDILVGRPFGGVAVLWRKKLSKYITVIDKDEDNGKFI